MNKTVAYLYYVWMGVFALFNSSLFWSVATDVYNEETASRLFGLVAAGMTLTSLPAGLLVGQCPLSLTNERLPVLLLTNANNEQASPVGV